MSTSRPLDLLYSDHKGNFIPLGRQLPRTPPSQDCIRQLDFQSECPHRPAEIDNEENQDPNTTFDFKTPPVRQASCSDPESMLKGMKGYQLTAADLEFMQRLKEEKELKRLQEELRAVQNLLNSERMALELALANKDKAQAELKQLPACEDIRQWSVEVLEMTAPSMDLSSLDTKALLALVTEENVQKVLQEKRAELKRLEKMVEKKKKSDAKQRGQLEKQMAIEQSKILCLLNRLVELKSALAQQEEVNKSLKTKQEATKVEKTATAPRRGKAKPKTEDSTNPSKPTRKANLKKSEPAASAQKIKPEALTCEGSSPAPPDQALPLSEGRVKRRAAAADPGDNGQKRDKQPGARPDMGPPAAPTHRRRKAPPSTPTEVQDLGLRRSKRIASRK